MNSKKQIKAIDMEEAEIGVVVAPIDKLYDLYQKYYKHNEFIREKWNIWYNKKSENHNKEFEEMIDHYFFLDKSIPDTVLEITMRDMKREKVRKVMKRNFGKRWFITLTSKPEWTEKESKERIDKYRQNHFKKYKYIWTEEHGGENGGYHQHILVEGEYFHTGQNLKPTSYYDANINVLRCGKNNGLFEYMNKESQIQGNTDYFF